MIYRSTIGSVVLAGALAAFSGLSAASALPLSSPPAASAHQPAQPVVQVHGCHRGIQRDYAGWHFHARGCLRQPTSPPGLRDAPAYRRYHRGPSCRYQCRHIGPVKTCEQVCR